MQHVQVKQADIVVSDIGKAQFVQGAWLKPGAVVIDVGTNYIPGKCPQPSGHCANTPNYWMQMLPRSLDNVWSVMWTLSPHLLSRHTSPPSQEVSAL